MLKLGDQLQAATAASSEWEWLTQTKVQSAWGAADWAQSDSNSEHWASREAAGGDCKSGKLADGIEESAYWDYWGARRPHPQREGSKGESWADQQGFHEEQRESADTWEWCRAASDQTWEAEDPSFARRWGTEGSQWRCKLGRAVLADEGKEVGWPHEVLHLQGAREGHHPSELSPHVLQRVCSQHLQL